jgi:hypothetical protein
LTCNFSTQFIGSYFVSAEANLFDFVLMVKEDIPSGNKITLSLKMYAVSTVLTLLIELLPYLQICKKKTLTLRITPVKEREQQCQFPVCKQVALTRQDSVCSIRVERWALVFKI